MITKRMIAALATATVMGVFTSGAGQAQVLGSLHDMRGSDTGENNTEVCVYCHTPHGADTGGNGPLWNRLTGSETYIEYSSSTMSIVAAADDAPVGSVSLACLSCHDGTQARDAVLNAPGTGLIGSVAGVNGDGTYTIGTIGAMPVNPGDGSSIANLGTDLSNDHPISIKYAGGGYTTVDKTASGGTGDSDFVAASNGTIGSSTVWWVNSIGDASASTREKSDMVLYTRLQNGETGPYVECGSCHDPHNSATGAATNQVSFLRIANSGSDVCRSCHVK